MSVTSAKLPERNKLRSAQETVMRLDPQVSPSRPLRDIRLSEEYAKLLAPILERASVRFTLTDEFVEDIVSGDKHIYTQITNHGIKRFLLQIPDSILRNPCRENRRAVNEVKDSFVCNFGTKITLYVFHDRTPHGSYKLMMEELWKQHWGITIKFNALSNLEDLQEMAEAAQNRYVKGILNLDILPDMAKKLKLPSAVFDQIVDLLCLPTIGDEVKKRKAVVTPAFSEYKPLYTKISWSGSSKEFAVHLVKLLSEYGELKPGKHALVTLLEALRIHVGSDDKEQIDLILEHLDKIAKQ